MGMTASQKALWERWETFLSRLEERSESLRLEASETMQGIVDEVLRADDTPTGRVREALAGIEARTPPDAVWRLADRVPEPEDHLHVMDRPPG